MFNLQKLIQNKDNLKLAVVGINVELENAQLYCFGGLGCHNTCQGTCMGTCEFTCSTVCTGSCAGTCYGMNQ